jgi:chorismate mutase/prephenate dehydratase
LVPSADSGVPPELEITHLDEQLVGLLNRRVALYLEKMKGTQTSPRTAFSDLDQQLVWGMIDRLNQGPLTTTEMRTIFRPLLSAGRQRIKHTRVAYLGPPFSFTHQAAISRFGESADLVPVSTIATVFEEVNRGHVDFGIVPIENSTDGRIVDTLDMFTRLPLRICGEVLVHVHHNLLARCDRSEISEIYSKPQALSQCRDWLSKNMPQARLIEVTSTSTAAQLARDKPNVAAVASRQAAIQYDVPIVAECIEDNRNNVTRFAVIGDSVAEPTGHDRTAVLLQIPHKPGSLSEALEPFRRNKVNLTWIESFPLRQPAVGYLFFLDFEGHVSEPRIKKTLKDLEALPPDRLEILGSYPRGEASK